MSLVGIFQPFIWVLIGLLMLVPIKKFLWYSSCYNVKLPKILFIFIASLLLSVYFGYVTSSDRAFAFPFAAQPLPSTLLSSSRSLFASSRVFLIDSPISTFLAQNPTNQPLNNCENSKNSCNCKQLLCCLQERRVPITIGAVILLSCLMLFWRRLFGSLLTGVTVALSLILLVSAIFIFVQDFPTIQDSTSSASPTSTPFPLSPSTLNIFVLPELPKPSPATSNTSAFLSYLQNLWQVLGWIILLGLLALVLYWLSDKKGKIVVLPFDVVSPELSSNSDQQGSQNNEGNKANNQKYYYGKAIADWLIEELHRIRQIYASAQELEKESTEKINIRLAHRNFPPLSCIPSPLGDELTEVGTVELGKARLSIGHLLLSLRRIWPFGGVEGIITGSIQSYNNSTRIVARIEYGKQMSAWEVETPAPIESISENTIQELAYKIAFEIVPNEKLPANTWKAFQQVTEAIGHLSQFFRLMEKGEKIHELEEAKKYLKEAKEKDFRLIKQSGKKSELLADLFYKIGTAYLLLDKNDEAKDNMEMALDTDSNWKNYHYYFNGLGNIYWKQGKLEEAEFEYNRCINHIKKTKEESNFIRHEYKTLFSGIKDIYYSYWNCIIYKIFGIFVCLRFIREVPQKTKQNLLVFPYPYNGLGNIYLEQNDDYTNAKGQYEIVIRKDNKSWKTLHNLGNVYLYFKKELDNSSKSKDDLAFYVFLFLVNVTLLCLLCIVDRFLSKLNLLVFGVCILVIIDILICWFWSNKLNTNDYNNAISNFQKAVELSQYKSAFSHSWLGLAYFFNAITKQADLLNIYNELDNKISNQKIDKYKDIEDFIKKKSWTQNINEENQQKYTSTQGLEEFLQEVQLAVDIDGENAVFYWNLGLVKLWDSSLDEVYSIWNEAVNKARQEEHASQEEHNLCCAIYSSAQRAIAQTPDESALSHSWNNYVEKNLLELNKQGRLKKGKIKMMIKDLSVVQIALLRCGIKSSSSSGNNHEKEDIKRVSRAIGHIHELKEILKTVTIDSKA